MITGGTVSVTGGSSAVGISGGLGSTGQRNTTGTAVVLGANVTVNKISSNYFSASILPVTDGYQITGSLTLPDFVSEYTIPAGKTLTGSSGSLTIPDGVTLTVEDGATVDSGLSITNNGTVKINCQNKDVSVDGKTELIHDWSNKDGVCINCGAAHKHADNDWTYTKGTAENTIIATCGVCHKEALVTLTAPTDLTYDGTAKTATVTITPEGLLTAPKITYSKDNVNAGNVTASIKLGDVTASVPYTIAKLSPVITVPTATFNKTFGDPAFKLGVTENNPEANAAYTSSNTDVAAVSSDGTVTIKGVGSATITVSLGATPNCYAAESKTITMKVNKASAPKVASENISYVNTKGSGGAVTIDVAGKLPKEKGVTTYRLTSTTDDNHILENVAVDHTTGKLTYTVKSDRNVGDKASITVTAEMANYEPATFTANISITDRSTSSSSESTGTEEANDAIRAMTQIDNAMENLKITKDVKAEEIEKIITDAIGESNVEYAFEMVSGDKELTIHVEVFKTVNGEKVSRENTYQFFFDKFVTKDGKKYFYDTYNQMVKGRFIQADETGDGFTYFADNSGAVYQDRLSYDPSGKDVIYFDEDGHMAFNKFINIKHDILGNPVDYIGYFDTFGRAYVNKTTYGNGEGVYAKDALFYINDYGVLENKGWFKNAAGEIGYATADGRLATSQWSFDQFGRAVYFQANGFLAKGTLFDGSRYYNMDENDGHFID